MNIPDISIDTNILLRLILNDVPAQHKAALKLFRTTHGQIHIADIAIMEVVFVLQSPAYGFSRQQVTEAIEGILDIPRFTCNRSMLIRAVNLFAKHPALSFEDCCLSVYAELNNATPMWTFDKKLANQAPQAKLLTV